MDAVLEVRALCIHSTSMSVAIDTVAACPCKMMSPPCRRSLLRPPRRKDRIDCCPNGSIPEQRFKLMTGPGSGCLASASKNAGMALIFATCSSNVLAGSFDMIRRKFLLIGHPVSCRS